jgi:uncharacterized protein (TIGR02246 family)
MTFEAGVFGLRSSARKVLLDPSLTGLSSLRGVPMLRTAVAASLFALLSCAHESPPAASDLSSVRASIEQAEAQYAKVLMAGDAPALAAFFTEDGVFILGAQKGINQGRAAVQAFNEERMKTWRYLDVTITTADVGVSGELAYERGTNRITRQQGSATPVTSTGRYLTVWRRQSDGRWLIQADMVVADPAP